MEKEFQVDLGQHGISANSEISNGFEFLAATSLKISLRRDVGGNFLLTSITLIE